MTLCLHCEEDLSKKQDSPKVYVCKECYDFLKENIPLEVLR